MKKSLTFAIKNKKIILSIIFIFLLISVFHTQKHRIKWWTNFSLNPNINFAQYVIQRIKSGAFFKPIVNATFRTTIRSLDNNPLDYYQSGVPNGIACRKVAYLNNNSGNKSSYSSINFNLDPKKTALILIDVWEGKLGKGQIDKLNRLTKVARDNNIKVVHCPSQRPNIDRRLKIYPDDLYVYGFNNIDKELLSVGIDTLLYAGYDALDCVLDKPMGIFHTHLRSDNFSTIVIRDCVFSLNKNTKKTAINIIETSFGCSITSDELSKYLRPELYNKSKYTFNSTETALVVVGTSDKHTNIAWHKRVEKNIKEKLVPLLEFARSRNITIIHVSSKNGSKNLSYKHNEQEPIIYSESEFRQIVKEKKIKNLLYAGYAINKEILFGPAGISRLYIRDRYQGSPLADYYIVSDATLALEMPDTLDIEGMKRTVLNHFRGVKIVTTEQLQEIFR